MRRRLRAVISLVVLGLLLALGGRAQAFCFGGTMAGNWHIVVPEATTNEIVNPSFETGVGDWSESDTDGRQAYTQSSDQSRFGAYSMKLVVTTGTNVASVYNTTKITVTASQVYRGSAYVYITSATGTPTLVIDVYNGAAYVRSVTVNYDTSLTNQWQRLELSVTIAASGEDGIYLAPSYCGNGVYGTWYVDGVQFENKNGYVTTYCDGDQPGCEWQGTEHASASERSAQSRAGGRVRNFDDYSFYSTQVSGPGMASVRWAMDRYALLPGGAVQGHKGEERTFILTGLLQGTGYADLNSKRQTLLDLMAPDGVPGNQAVRLRYDGAAVEKEIAAYYDGGLEFALTGAEGFTEVIGLRFLAPDPFWYEVGESATVLDTNDTGTLRYLAGRLRSTGQWSALGLTANPDSGGMVGAIAVGQDRKVYFGGSFVGLDGVSGRDRIAAYDPSAGTWSTVGSDSDFGNGTINALAVGPDGTLYAAGQFTNAGGDNDADYIAKWNGTSWSAVGVPNTGAASITSANGLAIDRDGNLYVGGNFTNWADVANADYFAKWDGSSWSAVGSGGTGLVEDIAVDSQGNIYIGGTFLNWAGVAEADRLAWWNGSAWAAVGGVTPSGASGALAVTPDDKVYFGGNYTDLNSIAEADYIALWDGLAWSAMADGLDGYVESAVLDKQGNLWVGANVTKEGGTGDFLIRWNKSSWAHMDITLPGSPAVIEAIALGHPDPVVENNYDIWIGWNDTGTAYYAGAATATNDGTSSIYPKVVFKRSGGTSARLDTLRNETTGKEIFLDYSLRDGETLIIDLRPTHKSVTSDFYGSRLDAVLANSDFGDFALQPGDNTITCYIKEAGSPTVTAYMVWRDAYWSLD